MIVIGITGSIAMGKSVLASQFAALGASVCNADDIVHRLTGKGGQAVDVIAQQFPSAVKDGAVDRRILGEMVFGDEQKRKQLERIIHPMVAEEETRFMEEERKKGAHTVVLDIPLLFETGAEKRCDFTVVATAPFWIQKRRAMKRPGMTEEKFRCIVASQMSDKEKRNRADFVVQTGLGKAYSFSRVKQIMKAAHAARDRS